MLRWVFHCWFGLRCGWRFDYDEFSTYAKCQQCGRVEKLTPD